ncbi:hypothetical protein [Streptomyces sp. 4F14]|uniref:hypothetical protein n=1 Tax=Streptomyces sp. 4F14 TaxID=3394380 RepID=UPI003A8A0786
MTAYVSLAPGTYGSGEADLARVTTPLVTLAEPEPLVIDASVTPAPPVYREPAVRVPPRAP